MANLPDAINDPIKALGGDWAKYTLVGSFALYLAGYLALRFHLTALGVATDLTVLDERYLFTGARFFVNLVATVPTILEIGLFVWLPGWAVWRLVPETWRVRAAGWRAAPWQLAVVGLAFSVAVIQLAMRKCFNVSDLLFADGLPHPEWLGGLLLDGQRATYYFTALVAASLATLAILVPLYGLAQPSPGLRRARALLAFVAAVQVLLLPINYGVLIMDKSLARVAAAGTRPSAPGETLWLVWEGKESVTFLIVGADGQRKSLLTLPRTQAQPLETLGIDPIVPVLFARRATNPPQALLETHP